MASRTCWSCSKDAHQTGLGSPVRANSGEWFLGYQCDACGVMSVGSYPVNTEDARTALGLMTQQTVAISWQPLRMIGKKLDDVPHPIDAAASEAWACFSVGQFRSSVLMARAVVEATAKHQGATSGNLMSKIDKLYKDELIGKGVKEAAHEIRFMGNDMAHGDFVVDVGEDECIDVLGFLEEFLNEVYQRPARLTAFREQRLARQGSNTPRA